MKTLSVPDMHCEMCVSRIKKALEQKKLDFSVSLDTHTITLNCADSDIPDVLETLDDLGFPATEQ